MDNMINDLAKTNSKHELKKYSNDFPWKALHFHSPRRRSKNVSYFCNKTSSSPSKPQLATIKQSPSNTLLETLKEKIKESAKVSTTHQTIKHKYYFSSPAKTNADKLRCNDSERKKQCTHIKASMVLDKEIGNRRTVKDKETQEVLNGLKQLNKSVLYSICRGGSTKRPKSKPKDDVMTPATKNSTEAEGLSPDKTYIRNIHRKLQGKLKRSMNYSQTFESPYCKKMSSSQGKHANNSSKVILIKAQVSLKDKP